MTEVEARGIIAARFGGGASDRVGCFLAMVIEENTRQNLVAPSTLSQVWARHALDSAQLIPLGREGNWLDIGTGGGFPGMIVALLREGPICLVEPRKRRAAFLDHCVGTLALDHVTVVATKVEAVEYQALTISARAVAPVEKLLRSAMHCATSETRWLLPRGRLEEAEVFRLARSWGGMFHVEQSLTDPQSAMLIVEWVSRP